MQRAIAAFADRWVPPSVLKHQIAWRNWRRGEAELRLLDELVPPGRVGVDIGAHLGAYTYFLARRCREVHAFEPQQGCVEFLRRAYRHGVIVHECALADFSGTAHLALSASAAQTARLSTSRDAGAEIAVRRLDEFELTDVAFIKLDAEGAEQRILAGAAATLARCRPRLLIEIEARHIENTIDSAFGVVQSYGYRGRYWDRHRWRAVGDFDVEALQAARLRGDRRQPYINNFVFDPD